MAEFLSHFSGIAVYLFGIIFTGLGFMMTRMIRDYDTRIKDTEKETNDIRVNYLKRFAEAEKNRAAMEKNLLAAINKMQLESISAISEISLENAKSHQEILDTLRKEMNNR